MNHVTDDQLRDMYWVQGLSGRDIAAILGCTPAAVCMRMKASGIKARKRSGYPATEKMLAAWVENGKRGKGRKMSAEAKAKLSLARTGSRLRDDYEFGGHEKKRPDGYIRVFVPAHPAAAKDGYVMKHRLVMERHIGRYLRSGEVVHHINHKRDDNRLENLRLMTVHDHMSMHMKERRAAKKEAA